MKTLKEFLTAATVGPEISVRGDMETIKKAIAGRYASIKKEGKKVVLRFKSHKEKNKAEEILKQRGIKAKSPSLKKLLPFSLK
jgi:hypothetical protein